MKRTTWRRGLTVAAAALSAVLALSGCATLAGTVVIDNAAHAEQQHKLSVKAAAQKGKPVAGDCWVATMKYADYANWGTRPPVNCSQPHQLYTFAVPQLQLTHKGNLFNSSGYVVDAVINDAWDTCGARESDAFYDLAYDTRVYLEVYVPEKNEWAKGARWVRCDIGVIALGSPYANPAFENLPDYASIHRAASKTPDAFNYCTNNPKGESPVGAAAVFADCTTKPQWVLEDEEIIPEPANDAYPTPAQLNTAYFDSCKNIYANATHVTFPVYPSASDWRNGTDTLQCWIGRK